MTRIYKRDAGGRFASNGGSRGPAKVGRAGPRGGKTGTRAEQRRNAKAQQERTQSFRSKAAPTAAKAAYKAAAGAARKAARSGPRNGIRPTGGLPRPAAANGIRRTTGARRGPLRLRANAIRAYEPRTPRGQADHGIRMMERSIKVIKGQLPAVRGLKKRTGDIMNRIARSTARTMIEAQQKGILGDVARHVMRGESGTMRRAALDVIRRRASRAAAAAARGSKPAARARAIYDRQLMPTVPGKPTRAKNNLRPGPSNTKGAPKPKRKPRKPRKPKD